MIFTEFAVRRRLASLAILVVLLVLGCYSLWRLPVDFLPGVTYPMIKVHIWWRGATPEEVERSLAEPIERQMATVDDLDYLESSSIEGMYTLLVNFRYGVDVNVAYQDALAAMARVARVLPSDIDPPVVIKADPSQLPVMQVTASGDRWDLTELRTWADEWFQDQLLGVPGVAGTEVVGGLEREIRVLLDPLALEKHGLTLKQVLKRLREENVEQFGGRVTAGPKEIIARTMGEYRSLDEIREVVLLRRGEARVLLRDVAEVQDSSREVRVITRLGGVPCVKLSVLKQASANTVEVAETVLRRLQELEPVLPPGIEIGVVENQAEYVTSALAGVRNAAIEAAILTILLVFLFLGSWRLVLVMVLTLPICMIINFALMKLAGFSLNIFSLGGLVIAIGVLVDNSIVVIETVTRRLQDFPAEPVDTGVIRGTTSVGPALIAGALSYLALFVPFLMVPGLTSLLFRELILVIAGIVVVALLVAVTVVPMLTATLLSGQRAADPGQQGRFERFFAKTTQGYGALLERVIQLRWPVMAISLVLLALAGVLAPRLGSEFLPRMDDGRIMVKVRLPTGAALAETDRALQKIEAAIGRDEMVESLFTLVGGKVWGLFTYEIANEGEVNIQLVPRHRRHLSTDEYIRRLRQIVSKIPVPGGRAMVMQMKVKGIRKLGDADIEVKIQGPEILRLFEIAKTMRSAMLDLDHFRNIFVSMDLDKPEYHVRIDRERAAELGVSVADISETLRTLVTGAIATRYREGEEYYDIRVLVPESDLRSHRDLEELMLSSADGEHLRLRDVAEVVPSVGPVEIVRENQVKQVIVRGDAAGVSVGQALQELKDAVARIELPVGYEIAYGGQAQMIGDMIRNVLVVFVFAVFFSFVVLTVRFDDLRLPAVILGSVPFCLAGMVFAMDLTGFPVGATVIIGVLVVVAATVNDGVLLITFADELREEEGKTVVEAVIEAARIRLRPRVMTTICVLSAFLPLALGIEEGSDMLQPMAVAAIGGLLMEILVALFLMPCLYSLLASTRTEVEARDGRC